MPDKRLKVKGVGAGDPTFVLRFELENVDSNDENSTGTINSIVARMDNDQISNPVLDSAKENYVACTVEEEIIVMSSFEAPEPNKSGGIISNGIIHVPTEVTFTSQDNLTLEYDGSLRYEINENTIIFPDGIDLIEPKALPLQDGKQTVAIHARTEDITEQGTNVFLTNSPVAVTEEIFICTSQSFVSIADNDAWEITYMESEGYCLLLNKERNKYLGSATSGYLGWHALDTPYSDKIIQWAIVNNGGKTSTIQNLQAVAERRASFLTANTKVEGGDVQLSVNSTPWYLHILE